MDTPQGPLSKGIRGVARRLLSERRRLVLIPAVLLALVAAYLLYPRFPRVTGALEGAEASAAGPPMLTRLLEAHGGMERFRAAARIEGQVDDEWGSLFEGFSSWPGYSAHLDIITAPMDAAYRSRLTFQDRSMWGFNGTKAWAADAESPRHDAVTLRQARLAAHWLPRLMLLPFSIAHEGAEVRGLRVEGPANDEFEVLEVWFSHPTRREQRDRWLLFIDTESHHILRVVFESSASDPPRIDNCFVGGRKDVGGLRLTTGLTCYLPSKLPVELHRMRFTGYEVEVEAKAGAFEPPGALGIEALPGAP